jgi:hypothetical protein
VELCFLPAVLNDRLNELAQVKSLPMLDAALAGCQREQSVDQLLLLAAEAERLFTGRSQSPGVRVGIGERDLQQRLVAGQWRSQLVGGVGDELTL